MRVSAFAAAACAACLCLAACSPRSASARAAGEYIALEPLPAEAPAPETAPFAVFDVPPERRIPVVFGYGYNDPAFAAAAAAYVRARFASPESGAVIMPLIFPDDFKGGRISALADKLDGADIAALAVLGAPEGTHRALARLAEGRAGSFPVISLFPQDDALGTEAASTLVFDAESPAGDEPEEDAAARLAAFRADAPELLFRVIRYAALLPEAPPADAALAVHAARAAGAGWRVLPFTDADTGLRSVNHFILARNAP